MIGNPGCQVKTSLCGASSTHCELAQAVFGVIGKLAKRMLPPPQAPATP